MMAALLCGATSALSFAQNQGVTRLLAGLRETSSTGSVTPALLTADDVIRIMLDRNRLRNEELHRYSVVRTYEIRNADGTLSAQAVVHVSYEAPEKKVFKKTSETGSPVVAHLVFEHLMEAEGETSSSHRSAMATENYSFAAVGEEDVGQHHCYVFRVIPKRKDKYLLEGKIWIDDREFAIVKIAGRPAKEPSLLVNQTYFVRRYEKFDGFWLPYRDETSADVKVYGRQIFTVNYQQYAVNSTVSAQTGSRESGAPD